MALSSVVVSAGITGTQTSTAAANNATTPQELISFLAGWNVDNGTGSSQANKFWASAARSIGASSSENLDLAASLTDSFGTAFTLTKVKAILVRAASGNTNDVLVGGAGANTFLWLGDPTDIVPVKPGGFFVWVAPGAGATVTAATGDILKVANSGAGTAVSYDIAIIGI